MNRNFLASAICASLLMAGTAFAQDNAASAAQPQSQTATTQSSTDADKTKAKTLESVSVSGTLLKRPEYQEIVPVQVVSIEADRAAGSFGTVGLLQTTAIAMGSTQINNQFSGFVVGGGTGIQTIDLRGLGANRTLVLLDSQRPGPAGTQGQTGSGFDLNVIPEVILGRIEIVKDGSSSIYGSDAISGVVNLITKKRIDGTEMEAYLSVPQHDGGQQVSTSIATGFNFDAGNIVLAAQFQEQFPLARRDRDFLRCSNDMVTGPDGQRLDREDRSILQGTPYAGCNNMLQNESISFLTGRRYVPSKDGSTIGPLPGTHPARRGTYANGGQAFYEEVLNSPFQDKAWALNKNRNSSFYGSSHFIFSDVTWDNQVLFNRRQTNTRNFRQFFPVVAHDVPVGSDEDASFIFGLPDSGIGLFQPVMPYTSNSQVTNNYYYLRSSLSGGFGQSSWDWHANGTYSSSSGYYSHMGIDTRLSGDLTEDANEQPGFNTPIDYFDPGILNGDRMGDLINAVGLFTKGHTKYKQSTVNAVATGNLFTLPAGDVSAAVGAEFRHYKIDDQPDPNNAAGFEWGFSSAQQTKGADNVREIFAEVGIPLLSGLAGIESLTADVSARVFKYQSVGDWSHVWKYGLKWQIVPTFAVRGSIGTSYRAPQLYELYLGNQSGFLGQLAIDPCILWRDSTNDFVRANCAAVGIPEDYTAAGNASAQIFQGGGKGFLKPETSRAKSLGVVWTPTFANVSFALDYFDYDIKGEIGTLDASDITFGCYGAQVFPNAFCALLNRNPANAAGNANMITDIHATFININSQRQRGYDLQANYSQDYSFGTISADAQITYTIEDVTQLFSSSEASGFENSNRIGYIGNPEWVGLFHASYKRGDWTASWQGQYFTSTKNRDISDTFTYQGFPGAKRDISADWQFLHNVSIGYDRDKWGVTFGVRNLFDTKPDLISAGAGTRYGNTPVFASQYDWFGRTFFARANYKF
ncbi:MAG: TonB-dependent receptor [Rhodanobacter sp.]